MAMNPMQKKARTSFLMGMLITLLITGIIIGLLVFMVINLMKEKETLEGNRVDIYVLNQDVKSGQVLTEDMFVRKQVDKTTIPSDATATAQVIYNWYLQMKDGTMVQTGKNSDGQYYLYYIDSTGNEVVINQESATGNYYTEDRSGNKTYVELNNVPVIAKLDMKANTVITPNLVSQSNEKTTKDMRVQDYNVIVLPVDLMDGDIVDIRLMAPNGQDFIVISKKTVEIPLNSDGTYLADTVRLCLREDEILTLSSAIVEASGIQGAKLYATRYKEAGIQDAAVPTYTPNSAVTTLIGVNSSGAISNPNIIEEAKNELRRRYQSPATEARNQYLQSIINNDPSYDTNVQAGMQESITNAETARKKYLESL